MDMNRGVKGAGIFRMICRECDSSIFHDYENIDENSINITQKILSQLALKSCLKELYTKKMSRRVIEIAQRKYGMPHMINNDSSLLDIEAYKKGINKTKKNILSGKIKYPYRIIYEKVLPYTVPIATQTNFALPLDLKGNMINHIFNMRKDYIVADIFICILPLKTKSLVLVFYEEKHLRYREFHKQFVALPENEKLALVNYMIFKFSESIYMGKDIATALAEDIKFVNLVASSGMYHGEVETMTSSEFKKEFALSSYLEVTNLLDTRYAK